MFYTALVLEAVGLDEKVQGQQDELNGVFFYLTIKLLKR